MNLENRIKAQDQHIGERLYQLSMMEEEITGELAEVFRSEISRIARIIVAENAGSSALDPENLMQFKTGVKDLKERADAVLGQFMGEHVWPHKRTHVPKADSANSNLEEEIVEVTRQAIGELGRIARPFGFRIDEFPEGPTKLGAKKGYNGRVDLTSKMVKLITQYQVLTNELYKCLSVKQSLLRDLEREDALKKWDDL
jgi:hypothetical protein